MKEITDNPAATLALPAHANAPAIARAAIGRLGPQLPADLVQKLSLVASELVTNVLRHSAAQDPAPTLSLGVTPARVTLAVEDRGTRFDLGRMTGRSSRTGGWGLQLVDSLVDRWWLECDSGTRIVCEVDRRQ